MSWNPRDQYNGIEYGGTSARFYWDIDYNPDARFSSCLSDCTCLAYGRVLEEGCRAPVPYTRDWSLPAASNWHTKLTNNWEKKGYLTYLANAKPGDIVEWQTGNHVAVIERVSGTTLYVSSSLYTGDNGSAYAIPGNPSSGYSPRTTATMGSTLQDVCNWMMVSTRMWRFYEYKTVDFISATRLGVDPDYILVNPDSGGYTPPTPSSETLDITISPASYTSVMNPTDESLDFTFRITITGIPAGETVSGGNTYPNLVRVANTGWSYTDYVVNGVTYREATKQQTLRYYRVGSSGYTTVEHMYFNITKSTGTISTDTPMYITVKAKSISIALRGHLARKHRKRGRMNATYYIN